MKKVTSILLTVIVLLLNQFAYASIYNQIPESLLDEGEAIKLSSISSDAAIVLDISTNTVLFSKNIDEKLAPAGGLTMLFSAIVALDTVKLTDIVTCTADVEAFGSDVKKLGLKNGDQITVYELISAMLIRSNVDAAIALAVHTSGSVDAFVEKLNKKATDMGLTQTLFKNPTGLQVSGQVSSANDMMEIAKAAFANDTIREIVAKPSYTFTSGRFAGEEIISVNEFLSSESESKRDDRVTGMVYATLSSSNSCAITSASVGERDVLVVVLKDSSKNRDKSITTLLDYAYEKFSISDLTLQALGACDNLPMIDGVQPTIADDYEVKIIGHKKVIAELDLSAPKLTTPSALPQTVGLSLGGNEVAKVNVVPFVTPTPKPTATPAPTATIEPTPMATEAKPTATIEPDDIATAEPNIGKTTEPTNAATPAATPAADVTEAATPTAAPTDGQLHVEAALIEDRSMTENIVFNLNSFAMTARDGMTQVRVIMEQLGWIVYVVAGGVALVFINVIIALVRIGRRSRGRRR